MSVLFLSFFAIAMGQNISINEVQTSNETTTIDDFNDFDDWIELKNDDNTWVDLSGWYLSDDSEDPLKWSFPDGPESIIEANGFLVIWADDETDEGFLHTNFALNQDGEQITLSNPDGEQIQQVQIGFNWQDFSWGWNQDNQWSLLDQPTPGLENIGIGFNGTTTKPIYSEPGGIMTESVSITLTAENGGTIYYTLDGSIPTTSSTVYTAPIEINSNTTIKSICQEGGKFPSLINTQSYLFGAEVHNPIIHLSCEADLFNGPNGLDNQPYNDTELPMDVCFFDEDGNQIHHQSVGLKVHAPDFRDHRSFRMYARGEYGESSIMLDIFPNRDFDEHKRLVLRNSGNDGIEIGGPGMRDALITSMYQSIDPDYGAAAEKPVNLFVNGEYRGLYNLRERQDEHWLYFVYGIQCDEVDFLERTAGETDTRHEFCGDWDDYDAMEDEAILEDLSVQENYDAFVEHLEMRNFMDYQITEIWAVNQDWLSNNMKFWKLHDEGGWNHVIWDVDWGLGTFYPQYPHGFPDWNALNFALSNWGGWTSAVETEIMQNLIENEGFVNDFSNRTADLLNSKLRSDVVVERLLEMKEQREPDVEAQIAKWGGQTLTGWETDIDYMISFINDRPGYMRQ
ncbi:MAG: CotH kinase family protein, partial [Flavobacteriales bacterium]|nr:CotH kinase family protein [Flavobacteriales bacterium]